MSDTCLFSNSPVILDGGFGTTLEELFNLKISESPLWSAQHISQNPETVIAAHLAFLRAGSQIISTSTYQCSAATFRRAKVSDADAQATMLKSVKLADDARQAFRSENTDLCDNIKIALSLGPFGASLSPAQEFDGHYPPPYGPVGFLDEDTNYNSFGEDARGESASIDALAHFHLDRLLIFSSDAETWKKVDIIAFETVPLAREVKAIRKAMLLLNRSLSAKDNNSITKPWWISFVFPDGNCPETRFKGGPRLTARDLVVAALKWSPQAEDSARNRDTAPIPTGIGINCTSPYLISGLVDEMTLAVQELCDVYQPKPWLVIYPNSGDIYDIKTRTWEVPSEDREYPWVATLAKLFDKLKQNQSGVWGGFAVGGCCRIGPTQIHGLKNAIALLD